MGAQVLTDALVLVNGADFSGQSNKVDVSGEVEALDATTFVSAGWKEVAAGLGSHEWSVEGFWAAGDYVKPDDRLWADLGVRAAWSASAAAAEGSVAYLGSVMSGSFKVGGDVGSLAPFTAAGKGSGPVSRGMLLCSPGTARTATGQTTGRQMGAVGAAQTLFGALHVCSVAGSTPSVAVKIQSSATQGGSYTDRLTFFPADAQGSQLLSSPGAVTDTWWRAQFTISGDSPSFLLAVAAGVK